MKFAISGIFFLGPTQRMLAGTVTEVRKGELVRLNVGGKRFYTTRATLLSSGDRNFFHGLLEGSLGTLLDEKGCFFIDRSPELFTWVLEYLRTKQLRGSAAEVLEELDFYGIKVAGLAQPPPANLQVALSELLWQEHRNQMLAVLGTEDVAGLLVTAIKSVISGERWMYPRTVTIKVWSPTRLPNHLTSRNITAEDIRTLLKNSLEGLDCTRYVSSEAMWRLWDYVTESFRHTVLTNYFELAHQLRIQFPQNAEWQHISIPKVVTQIPFVSEMVAIPIIRLSWHVNPNR